MHEQTHKCRNQAGHMLKSNHHLKINQCVPNVYLLFIARSYLLFAQENSERKCFKYFVILLNCTLNVNLQATHAAVPLPAPQAST